MSRPTAYVPGYEHDLFVSYAWVDNQSIGGGDPSNGWVHALVDNLRALLNQQLGRVDWGDIWLDRRIDKTQAITPEVEAAVQSSALLLIVLSEGYLASPWCGHELDLFQKAGQGAGQIFVVHKMDIEPDRRPPPIRELLGFDFVRRQRGDGEGTTLGFPFADPENSEDRPYYLRANDLSRELAVRLKELRKVAGAPRPSAQVPDGIAPPVQEPGGEKAIFLAETTPDLNSLRDRLARQLDQSVLPILPTSAYARSPDAFRAAMQRDLVRSMLFVQVLGPYTSVKSPDLPTGYEGLQLELAQGAGLPILRWRDPDLDPQKTDDPDLFARAEVIACGFEDFKRQVETQARRLLIPPPKLPAWEAQILIRASAQDEDTACRIGDTLFDQHEIGYELTDESDPLSDLVAAHEYQGLMVVYDTCDRDWVKTQIDECRVVAMDLRDRAPACAVFDQPRPDKRRLGIKLPRFHFLSDLSGPALNRYLAAVTGGAA